MAKTLTTVALTALLVCLQTSAAHSGNWKEVGNSNSVLLFQPPYMAGWTPGITVQKYDAKAGHAEWLCWRRFNDAGANACLVYQKIQGGFNNHVRSSNDILRYYDDFDDIEAVKDGDRQEIEHPIGSVDFRRFYFGGSNRKNCFSFIFDLGTRSADLIGWYCAPKGKELPDDVIGATISTVGIKGKHKPDRVTYENYN